jgi:N-acetyl-alpha-D-muramate 1-phosphate uridylyltransferase
MIELSKTAMVLAAGLGKRLGEVTKNIPKPLVSIGKTCCLEISLIALKKAGFKRIIINTHYHANQIETYVQRFTDLEIILSYESELLETAGGVRKVLDEFGGKRFVVVNADMYWCDTNPSIIQQMTKTMEEADDFCLAVTPLSNAQGYPGPGDFVLENGLLQRPGDSKAERYVYIGVQLINLQVVAPLPITPNSFSGMYTLAGANQRLRGVVYNGICVDVGSIAGLNVARAIP